MFTGLVQDIGEIQTITMDGDWRIRIQCGFDMIDVPMGASIMCSGVCLTVIEKGADTFDVEASNETIAITTLKSWRVGAHINLERSLTMGDELGGHFVFGHVDTLVRLVSIDMDADSRRLRLSIPQKYMKYIAAKGSVSLDGISLTVNDVDDTDMTFGVNIIPHTWDNTTLKYRAAGDDINFEVDMLARYVARMIAT